MKKFVLTICSVFVALLFTACGGGGGGGGGGGTTVSNSDSFINSPQVTVDPPILELTLSNIKTTIGAIENLIWNAKNAKVCQGSDNVAGTVPVSGSLEVKATAAGQKKYTISCTGEGGTISKTVTLIVPIPVQSTSYLNAKNLNIPSFKYPEQFKEFKSTGAWTDYAGAGVALADFEQNGTLSMVWFSNRGNYGLSPEWPVGSIYFFKFDGRGELVDITANLVDNIVGCIAPRKLLVADFNKDGKPDVYASCHGSEVGPMNQWIGEKTRILLSQPDGKYKNIQTNLNCYCHASAAADIDGDGDIDIITSDGLPGATIYDSRGASDFVVLYNDGNGNFTIDRRFGVEKIVSPWPTVNGVGTAAASPTIELIDVNNDGQADLVVGGYSSFYRGNLVLLNNKGRFDNIAYDIRIPVNLASIDIVYAKPNLYFYGLTNYGASADDYIAVYRYNTVTRSLDIMYNSNGRKWPDANIPIDFIWIMPYNGYLVPFSNKYTDVKIPM